MRCRNMLLATLFGWIVLGAGANLVADPPEQPPTKPRPNVLFLAVDDLRPELGCYGREEIVSPHIDRLASESLRFERAYCMVPVCGASRASLMTGLRPLRKRFVGYDTWAERDAPDAVPMNAHFKAHGYTTISLGKIFHHPADCGDGWSEPAWRPRGGGYRDPANQRLADERAKQLGRRGRGPAFESFDAPDETYSDGMVATKAVETLRRLKREDAPFFLAVGFFKPHLPFVAPEKYWKLYDPAKIKLPSDYDGPHDAPAAALHNSGELRAYAGVPPRGPVPHETARQLIHGYYACVSFTDAQIGRVLNELRTLGLAENTIVVLWSDHGWNLGEHGLWCKHACFETSMRIPLLVHVPGGKPGVSPALVETVDLYPTLCELADLPRPRHVVGRSLRPLLENPQAAWAEAAIGRYMRGDTLRTDQWRYTEFTSPNGQLQGRMLFDLQADPHELRNLVEAQPAAVKPLAEKLPPPTDR